MKLIQKIIFLGAFLIMANNADAACPSSLDFEIKLLGEDKKINICNEYKG